MIDRRYFPSLVVEYFPEWLVRILEKYVSFFITGVTGVLLNLGLTWTLTELVFGVENYFYAYLVGLSANLMYNFLRHSFVTFNTSSRHKQRFVLFVGYSLAMAGLQAVTVKYLVSLIGNTYYLPIIAAVIFVFSTVTFVVCNWWLFRE